MIDNSNSLTKQRTVCCSLLIFLLFFVPHNLKSQSLSFNLNSISLHPWRQEHIKDTLFNPSKFSNNKAFNYDVAYSYSLSNTSELFFSIGAINSTGFENQKEPIEAPFSKGELVENEIRKEITVGVGFLKNLLDMDRFILKGGFAFDYTKSYIDESKIVVEFWNDNDIKILRQNIEFQNPNRINYGISVMLRTEYFLTNSISIYLDLNYLNNLMTRSGMYTTTTVITDLIENEVISESITKRKDTYSYFSQRPTYSLGISWNFRTKENTEKLIE